MAKQTKEPEKYQLTKRELADIKVLQSIQTLLNAGYSYKKIAYMFNLAKTPTRQGGQWSAVQVFRIAKRNQLKKQKLSTRQEDITPWTKEYIIQLVIRNRIKSKAEGIIKF